MKMAKKKVEKAGDGAMQAAKVCICFVHMELYVKENVAFTISPYHCVRRVSVPRPLTNYSSNEESVLAERLLFSSARKWQCDDDVHER